MIARPIAARHNDTLRGKRGDRKLAISLRTAPLTAAQRQPSVRGAASISAPVADARPAWAALLDAPPSTSASGEATTPPGVTDARPALAQSITGADRKRRTVNGMRPNDQGNRRAAPTLTN